MRNMTYYEYDDLLAPHFQKVALVQQLVGAAVKAAPTVAKAVAKPSALKQAVGFGIGATTGIPGIGGTAGNVGAGLNMAHTVAGSMSGPNSKPSFNGMKMGAFSLREKEASYRLKRADEHGIGTKLLHMSPYAAWIASKALEGHHDTAAKALSAAAYLGYAGNAAHDAVTKKEERVTGAVDALGLLAMLGSDVARWRRPPEVNPGH